MPHKSPKFKVYDTLSSFCAGEGIHPALAKRAKAENCPHVKPGGRFDSRAAEWIRKQSWDEVVILDKERLECERIEKQNRKLDFEHQVRLGKFEQVDVVKQKWAQAMEAIMAAMQQYMTREDYNACIRQIRANIRSLDL